VRTVQGLSNFDGSLRESVLTVGNFDGVHRAHQELLRTAAALAKTSAPVVVLTFEPHPLTVVAPEKAPPRLTSLQEKLAYLEVGGAGIVVVANSEPALLTLTAEQFVEEVLVARFHPGHIVEGPSFGFGRGRKGTPQLLEALAPRFGYTLHVVPPLMMELEPGRTEMVSSSMIRSLLRGGQVEKAAEALTRPYSLTGEVVRGRCVGRGIGFPTANLGPTQQVIPGEGVYAGEATVGGRSYSCAINVGSAPTFGVTETRVEAHLLDFDGDLYGQSIRLTLVRRLRSQQKFASSQALAEQLRADVRAVRELSSGTAS
jgi:riboflavin kinase/FMN adenylyltransferase